MKKFCESVTDYAMEIINFNKKKKWRSLTNELQKSYENAKIYYVCKEKFEDENYCTVRDHCYFTGEYRGAAHSICNLK